MLDHVPLATLKSLVLDGLVLIAYLNHNITVDQAFIAVGITTAGAGVLGHARNGAGRGVKRG